jgi:hypothetical protein
LRSCTLWFVDPSLDLEARRLYLSAALSRQAARSIRGRIVADSDAADLLALARDLGEETARLERNHRLSFEPPYPGVTAGVEVVGGSLRLLLACHALGRDGEPLGVVFTALIPGRPPQVSVAPASTPIPGRWLLPEEL